MARTIKIMVAAGVIDSATVGNKSARVDQHLSFPDLPFSLGSQYIVVKFSGKPMQITIRMK